MNGDSDRERMGIHWNDLQTNPTMASCERKVPTRLSVSTDLLYMLESQKSSLQCQ